MKLEYLFPLKYLPGRSLIDCLFPSTESKDNYVSSLLLVRLRDIKREIFSESIHTVYE